MDWTSDWTGLISDQDGADQTAICRQQISPKLRNFISGSVTSKTVETSFPELQKVIDHAHISINNVAFASTKTGLLKKIALLSFK